MPASVKIALNPGLGSSRLEVDGVDVSNLVSSVQVSRNAKDTETAVTLILREGVEVDAEVEQVLAIHPGRSPREALQELLAGVDAGELEAEALGRMNGLEGGPDNPTQAILQVLRDWAKEA